MADTPALSQAQEILRLATEGHLFAVQNPAYMHLFKENMKLTGQLESLEKAYAILASAPGVVAQATAEVIQDTTPENPNDYPDITYWCKHRSHTTKSHKGPCPAKKAQDLKKAQGSGNSSSEYSSSDDSSDEDESSDEEDRPVEGNNMQSVEDPKADTEDDPLPHQLPFTAPRTSPRRPTRTASSTSPPNTLPSSAPPASKQKQKPHPVGFNPNPLNNIIRASPTTGSPEAANTQNNNGPNSGPAARRNDNQTPTPGSAAHRVEQTPAPASTYTTPAPEDPTHDSAACSDDEPMPPPPSTAASNAATPAPERAVSESGVATNPGAASTSTTPDPSGNTSDTAVEAMLDMTNEGARAPKPKVKKSSLTHPGTSNTARNLYAIDYLKDHEVTCEQFCIVWENLASSEREVYTQWAKDAKKTAANTTSSILPVFLPVFPKRASAKGKDVRRRRESRLGVRWSLDCRDEEVHGAHIAADPYGGLPDGQSHIKEGRSLRVYPLRPPPRHSACSGRPTALLAFIFIQSNAHSFPKRLLPSPSVVPPPGSTPSSAHSSPTEELLSPPPRRRRSDFQDILMFNPANGSLSLRRCEINLRSCEQNLSVPSAVPRIGGTAYIYPLALRLVVSARRDPRLQPPSAPEPRRRGRDWSMVKAAVTYEWMGTSRSCDGDERRLRIRRGFSRVHSPRLVAENDMVAGVPLEFAEEDEDFALYDGASNSLEDSASLCRHHRQAQGKLENAGTTKTTGRSVPGAFGGGTHGRRAGVDEAQDSEPVACTLKGSEMIAGIGREGRNVCGRSAAFVRPSVPQTRKNYVLVTLYSYTNAKIHSFQGTQQPTIWMDESAQVVVVPGTGTD
ncbi:hypothetical protein V8E53_015562 [Lactarius tabidus]